MNTNDNEVLLTSLQVGPLGLPNQFLKAPRTPSLLVNSSLRIQICLNGFATTPHLTLPILLPSIRHVQQALSIVL